MASYEKRGSRWRVRLYIDGQKESGTFPTKAEAVAWAVQREAELTGARLPDHTVTDAFRRYAREVSPTHRGEHWELRQLRVLEADALGAVRLPKLAAADIAAWRDRRLQRVSAATVNREMNLVCAVFEVARKEWGWLRVNPHRDVKRPPATPNRRRRITPDEVIRLTLAFGLGDGLHADTATQRVGLAFLFALETAMRSGEILGLRWEDVREKAVRLPHTKNGDARDVPLSMRARAILAMLPRSEDTVFGLDGALRDALWRKVRDRCEISDLHFHDSRAEAIWRLSKKVDVMELARIIGHRDLRSILFYYETSADELADRLG